MTETRSTGQSPDTERAPPVDGLPVLPPLSALLEIVVLILLPGALDYGLPSFPNLNETQPHFFWLPVLLLTLQYGSVSGLLAAGTAIVVTSLLGWPEQDIGENHFNYLLRIWLQPVLWIATAVVLGQLRLSQIERKMTLERDVRHLTAQRTAIASHARNLRERCDRLERLIATRRAPDGQLLLANLGRIDHPQSDVAATALADALQLAFPKSTVGIYKLQDERLVLAFTHKGAGEEAPPGELAGDSRLAMAVLEHSKKLSVLTKAGEAELSGYMAAVPIVQEDQQPVGAMLLTRADATDLDDGVLDRMTAIAVAIARRLASEHDYVQAHRAGNPAETSVAAASDGRSARRLRLPALRARVAAARGGRSG